MTIRSDEAAPGQVPQATAPEAAHGGAGSLGYQPLYKKVKSVLVSRIATGAWRTGAHIPNEFQLAAELGVSQGTVRKALHEMTLDNLLVRHQGRGTFVAGYDDERILFQFFRLTPDAGQRAFPDSVVLSLAAGKASPDEAEALAIAKDDAVWRIRRRRTLLDRPIIVERLVLPQSLFPDLDRLDTIPNNVYGLYASRYGVTIARAQEKLKAVAADQGDAEALACAPDAPLLEIDRRAFALDGRIAEWRISRCLTDAHHYLSDLK